MLQYLDPRLPFFLYCFVQQFFFNFKPTYQGLACGFQLAKFLPPWCSGSAHMCSLLPCSPMGVTSSTMDLYPFPFYQFKFCHPVCFSIYRHAQYCLHCLSNFLVSLCSCFPAYYLNSLSGFPCTDPGFVYCFCLPAACPDFGLFTGPSSAYCHLYSAHVSGLCIFSWAYQEATTWFQSAAGPSPPSWTLVKKWAGA